MAFEYSPMLLINVMHYFIISDANGDLALICGPFSASTHGTKVSKTAMPPNRLEAPPIPKRSYICSVKSGKAPPIRFREKDWAAMAELAYR